MNPLKQWFNNLYDSTKNNSKEVRQLENGEILISADNDLVIRKDDKVVVMNQDEMNKLAVILLRNKIEKQPAEIEPARRFSPTDIYTLHSGRNVKVNREKDEIHITGKDGHWYEMFLSGSDVRRLYGILHPAKVHGKWKGYCGEGPDDSETQS